MAAAAPTSVRDLLHDAPRSLRALSEEHADGWGIALRQGDDWAVHRRTTCAARCAQYASMDLGATLVIAHVRKKTVGELAIANTHPFRRRNFVFAHNGTVTVSALEALVGLTAPEHTAAIEGSTDSERLFAFVLTRIDEACDVARGVASAVRVLHAIDGLGSATFLLSCGARLYAHRLGRTLFVAHRDGVSLVASETLTDSDHWTEVPERAVVVIDSTAATRLAA